MDIRAKYISMKHLAAAVDKLFLSAAENPQTEGFQPKMLDAQLKLTYNGMKIETIVHIEADLLRPELEVPKLMRPATKKVGARKRIRS